MNTEIKCTCEDCSEPQYLCESCEFCSNNVRKVQAEALRQAHYEALCRSKERVQHFVEVGDDQMVREAELDFWLLQQGLRNAGFGELVNYWIEAKAEEDMEERAKRDHDAYHGW